MKNFPYINWYQNDNQVFINILNHKGDPIAKIINNFLSYNDSKYEFNLELFDTFTIQSQEMNRNNYNIILVKNNNNCWDSLLKDRTKYKYFISLDWDKYNTYLKSNEPESTLDNSLYNEEEFQKLMKSGALDEISSDTDDDNDNSVIN